MQQRHDKAATMAMPPMHPIDYRPEDLYSVEEMALVRDWLKSTLRCRGVEEFEKAAKSWKDESRAEVARILRELREKGFYPDRVGEDGRIVWGAVLRGNVQIELNRNAAKHEAVGDELMRRRGFNPFTVAGQELARRSRA